MKKYIDKIIVTFVNGAFSKKTTGLFYRWLVSEEAKQEKDVALKEVWKKVEVPAEGAPEESFVRLMRSLKVDAADVKTADVDAAKVDTAKVVRVHQWKVWRYAAVLALLCVSVVTTMLLTKNVVLNERIAFMEHYVRQGSMETIQLPDGSVAVLNAGSYMYYPENFKGKERLVYLVGEGDFKVAKNPDKPFIVHSSNMEIMALGTEFNVKAFPEEKDIIATLVHGRVKVSCSNDSSYVLSAGEQVVYNRESGMSRQQKAHLESVTAWQRGEIVVNDATIPEIIEIVERHFNIHMKSLNMKMNQDTYYFEFNKEASLEEVLSIMGIVIGKFDYKIKGSSCTLYWK